VNFTTTAHGSALDGDEAERAGYDWNAEGTLAWLNLWHPSSPTTPMPPRRNTLAILRLAHLT
jgi:hypothetical protein